jgi:hypothetical protein
MINSSRTLIRTVVLSLLAITYAIALKAQGVGASPAALLGQTGAGSNVQRVTETNAASFADFAAAVDAVAVGGGTLVVSTPQTLSGDKLVPAGVFLKFERGGQLSARTPVTVSIREPITAGRWLVFGDNVTAQFKSAYPDTFFPEWWGAKGDDATDDLAAFDRMIAALQAAHVAHILLAPPVTYYLSGVWQVDATVLLEGLGSSSGYLKPMMRFAPNSPGIVIHGLSTKTGAENGRLADFSTVRNVYLAGAAGALTHTGTIATTNGVIKLTRATGPAFSDAGGYHEGNTISVSNADLSTYEYMIQDFFDGDHVTLKAPRVMVIAHNGDRTVWNAIGSGNSYFSSWWAGQQITIGGATYTISRVDNVATGANGYGRLTLTTPVAGLDNNVTSYLCTDVGGSPCYIGDATILGGTATGAAKTMRPNLFHGLDMRISSKVEQVYISGFAGNCLNLDSSFGPTAHPATVPNQNVAQVLDNKFYSCYGSGLYAKATNANQIRIESNDATNNHGAGFAEFGFLGNRYHANHASFDFWGGHMSPANTVNSSTFIGEYTEGGMPSSRFDNGMLIIGGDLGAGQTGGVSVSASNGMFNLPNTQFMSYNGKATGFRFGSNQPNTLLGFGATEDAANTAVGGTSANYQGNSYQFGYDQLRAGWFNLYYGGNSANSQGNSVLAVSGSPAPEGAGKLWLYRGIDFIGDSRDVGLMRSAANTLKVTDGAGGRGHLDVGGLTVGGTIYSPLKTDTFAPALTLDFAQGNVQTITLTGNVMTLALTHLAAGGEYILRVAQDSTGGRTIAWANVHWANGTPPRLSTGAGKVDIFKFISADGATLEEISRALDVR